MRQVGQPRSVTAKIWNAAIQATLDKHGSVHLSNRGAPYYLDAPIILKSGQKLTADREAEIRLKPGSNTCMVRNEHIVGFADQPVPDDLPPDTDITIAGGIWTTLANDVWLAWQYDRPETGEGVVQAFRRPDSNFEAGRFKLRGLDPVARYVVTDLDRRMRRKP